jgi:hypothetical protein
VAMIAGVKVEGLQRTLDNLNKKIADAKNASHAGLLAAAIFAEIEAKKLVPREYSNLFASSFARKTPESRSDELSAEVGFGAAYALYIHENMEQKLKGEPRPSGLGVYWGPSGQPKFLEAPIQANHDKILRIIASYARDA